MRRTGFSILYFVTGMVTTWLALWIGSRVNWRVQTGLHLTYRQGNCHEIDLCSPPWWATLLFLCYIFGPTLIFAVVGWRLARDSLTFKKLWLSLVALTLPTMLIFVGPYVVK
jgi:hypothetical protein